MEALWSVNSDGGWGYLSDGVHIYKHPEREDDWGEEELR